MAKGDKQLMMSLTLVLVGSAFFLSGMGSQYWVQDSGANRTLHCGLWTTCQHVNGSTVCSSIAPGTSKAYFEAARVLEGFAVLSYCLTLLFCFTADDRHPSESCAVCVRRYFHIVAAFSAGGLAFVIIVVFAAGYKDDDWFLQPTLSYSYWLTFAGCLCTTAGGIMRIVFLKWPDRPALPMRKMSKHIPPPAPAKRRAKTRVDDELGTDPLPPTLRAAAVLGDPSPNSPGKPATATEKRPSRIKSFFAWFQRKKPKSTEAGGVSTVSEAVRDKQHEYSGAETIYRDTCASESGAVTATDTAADNPPSNTVVTAGKLKSALKSRTEDSDDDSLNWRSRHGHRKKNSDPSTRTKRKRRVGIVEPFVGYNIPPSPFPELLPDMEEGHGEGALCDARQSDVRSYELAMDAGDLRERAVSTPPAVVFPPQGEVDEINHYLTVKKFVDNCRRKAST